MKRLTFPADPIVVELKRFPDSEVEDCFKLKMFRGDDIVVDDHFVGRTAKLLRPGDLPVSDVELHKINTALLAEWAQWPANNADLEPIDMYEELGRIVDEYRARKASEGGV